MQIVNAQTQAPVINLDNARHALVGGVKKTGEVLKAYADAMNQAFTLRDNQGEITTPWYDLKGKLKAGVNEERAKFVAEMQTAGFEKATIDVYWQRVKEASGRVKTSTKVTGGPTDVDGKTVAELKTIINRIFKAEEDGTECLASEYKRTLMDVFEQMGGDIDKLG